MKSFFEKNYGNFVLFGSALGLLGILANVGIAVMAGWSSGDWGYELSNIWTIIPFLIPTLMGFLTFRSRSADWSVAIAYLILGLLCLFLFALFAFSDSALGTGLVLLMVLLPIAALVSLFLIIKYFIKNERKN